MLWQDVLMSITSFGFACAMIPSIMGKSKPSRLTCLFTCVGLVANGLALGTLGLYAAFSSAIVTLFAWGILLAQKRTE